MTLNTIIFSVPQSQLFSFNICADNYRSLTSLKIEYGDPNVCMDYDIKKFGMTQSCCVSMAALLTVTHTLTELILSSNLITDDKVGDELRISSSTKCNTSIHAYFLKELKADQ